MQGIWEINIFFTANRLYPDDIKAVDIFIY